MYLLHLTTMQSYNYIHSCARIIALALTNALIHSRISTRSRCLARALSHSYYQLLYWTCSTLSIISMHALAYCNSFYCIITCSRLAQHFLFYHRIRSPCSTLSIVSTHALALLNAVYYNITCATLSMLSSHALTCCDAFYSIIAYTGLLRRFLFYHRLRSPVATLSIVSSLALACCDAFYSIIVYTHLLRRFPLYRIITCARLARRFLSLALQRFLFYH